jgi:hypothetical protein
MDKFLVPTPKDRSTATSSGISIGKQDLLSLLKTKASEPPKSKPQPMPVQKINHSRAPIQSSSVLSYAASFENDWSSREKNVNMANVICNERYKTMNTNVKGWKILDGKKTYVTFRNGKLVKASGAEGFMLAAADESKKTANAAKRPASSSDSMEDGSLQKKSKSSDAGK